MTQSLGTATCGIPDLTKIGLHVKWKRLLLQNLPQVINVLSSKFSRHRCFRLATFSSRLHIVRRRFVSLLYLVSVSIYMQSVLFQAKSIVTYPRGVRLASARNDRDRQTDQTTATATTGCVIPADPGKSSGRRELHVSSWWDSSCWCDPCSCCDSPGRKSDGTWNGSISPETDDQSYLHIKDAVWIYHKCKSPLPLKSNFKCLLSSHALQTGQNRYQNWLSVCQRVNVLRLMARHHLIYTRINCFALLNIIIFQIVANFECNYTQFMYPVKIPWIPPRHAWRGLCESCRNSP